MEVRETRLTSPVKHAVRTPVQARVGELISYVVNPAKELWNEIGLEPMSYVEQQCKINQ